MNGKQVIITGATQGIGKEIAMGLGALDANLVLASRDLARGEHVAHEITHHTGNKNITVMNIDTSSQQSIHDFAKQYRAKP